MARLFSIFCFRHISSSQRVWLCEKWIKSPVVWWSRQIIGRRSNFPILKTFLKHSFISFEPGTVFHFNQQSAREQWHKNYSLSLATTLENLSHFMWEFTEIRSAYELESSKESFVRTAVSFHSSLSRRFHWLVLTRT